MPVSVRRPGEEGGNRISTVLVDLPTDEADPAARLTTINAAMRELKDSAAVRAGALILGASGWAPPLVSSTLARAMSGVRAFNLVVSNVPGPQQPFWLNGQRLLEAYPAVPLNPANQGLTVGVLSYDGGVHFGLLADRDLDPPLAAMQRGARGGHRRAPRQVCAARPRVTDPRRGRSGRRDIREVGSHGTSGT